MVVGPAVEVEVAAIVVVVTGPFGGGPLLGAGAAAVVVVEIKLSNEDQSKMAAKVVVVLGWVVSVDTTGKVAAGARPSHHRIP